MCCQPLSISPLPSASGEVPKFFDNVLSKRANEAVSVKGLWWDARRDVAQEGIKEKAFKVTNKSHTSIMHTPGSTGPAPPAQLHVARCRCW